MSDHPFLAIFEVFRDKRTAREKRIDEIKWKIMVVVILASIIALDWLAIVGFYHLFLV